MMQFCIIVPLYSSDETICKRVLDRSVNRLIEDLDVITVLDYSIEKEFFSAVECRDIKVCFSLCHFTNLSHLNRSLAIVCQPQFIQMRNTLPYFMTFGRNVLGLKLYQVCSKDSGTLSKKIIQKYIFKKSS
jgi:hypothetical protein